MRKTIFLLILLVLCVIVSLSYAYTTYYANTSSVKKFNNEFEYYKDREIVGSDIATVINKAVDHNEKYGIPKDTKGNYQEEEEHSLKVNLYIAENKTMYSMETIYKVGVEKFVNNFSAEKFKCTKIEYHEKSKQVKYLLFEEMIEK